MADKIVLSTNVGTGDSVAADDLGAFGKAQWVKLMDGTDGGTDVIPGTAASGLRVDPGPVSVADGGTLPAKGVQVGGTDGTVFQVLSTDSAGRANVNVNGTVPVSAASLPLPAGASTAAKQPALGTAGTPSADVLSVQGVAGGTAVPVSGTVTASGPLTDTQLRATPVPVSGTVTASGPLTDTQLRATAVPVSGTVTASGPLTDTQLRATAVPVSGTVTANLGTAAVTNAGTFAVQDSQVIADDAAFGVASTKLFVVGYLADETATDSVDEGDAGAARMTLDRKLIVTVEPHTAGGWDTKNCTSGDGSTALTNTAQAIKASAGKLGGWFIYNPNASAVYVPIYNVASGSVTVGTTNPLMVLTIPAASATNLEMVNGITFDTAIAAAAATTGGGATAPGTALEANFFFK